MTDLEESFPEELFQNAVREALSDEADDEAYWQAVYRLQALATPEVFTALKGLAQDSRPAVRALAPDVMRYLGGRPQPFLDETLVFFRELVAREREPEVLAAVGLAFVDMHGVGEADQVALDLMAPLASHADAGVRNAVVHVVLANPDPRAVELFLQMSDDPVSDVRNWCCFGLVGQLEMNLERVDSPRLREALHRRLADEDADTRAEALMGLALCKDSRALEALLTALGGEEIQRLHLEVAAVLKDPALFESLQKWQGVDSDDAYWTSLAKEAMDACRPPEAP